jgi:hypothetical protein
MRLPVLAVASLVVIAAIAGLVLGGVYRSEPAPRAKPHPTVVAAGGVRLELPSGWARGRATTLAGFHQPLWLRDPHAGLRAGVELLPAASPTLLPVGLHASGAPSTVELGQGRQAWRYQVARTDAVPQVLYAVPTTKGIATVGCLGVSGSVAERACKQLAVALTVPGARRLAPEKRAAFFSRLPATVAGLEAARVKGIDALDVATRPAAQALAADGLARAHRAAAADLAPLSGEDDLTRATVGDLGETASAYTALADAARARVPQPYAAARSAVLSADDGLRRTMARDATAVAAASTRVATAPPAAKPASTPAATPASTPAATPASTPAATPASTPAATPARTPAATPASTPAATPAQTPTAKKRESTAKSVAKTVTDAESKPFAIARPPAAKSSGTDLTIPLLLLFAAVAGFFAVRAAVRSQRS